HFNAATIVSPTPTPSPTPLPGVNNYYLSATGSDSNSCTQASPCATINSVDSRLGSSLTLGTNGTTIHAASGTYSAAITTNKSGIASARIKYIADTKWGARIATVGAYTMWTNKGNYVDIVGFDVTGDGHIGINNTGSFDRIIDNHVHNIPVPGGCTDGMGGGVVEEHGDGCTATDGSTLLNHVGYSNASGHFGVDSPDVCTTCLATNPLFVS